ncbi:MAG: hypothetical protein SGJ19_05410 [Planctomycetia bacterium]|nr:hypothetical protein [Planctomycetia bacterium]
MYVFLAMLCTSAALAADTEPPPPISGSREMFSLYGFDDSYFAKLPDATPYGDDQTEAILRGLIAVRRFSRVDLARWRHPASELPAWLATPEEHSGEVVELRGRVKRVTRIRPIPEVARRFELDVYYRCDVELAKPETEATVFALAIPRDWLGENEDSRECDLRCGGATVFLKRQAADAAHPAPLFIAQRLAWFPEQGNFASLGSLGFDAGLIDGVRDKIALSQSSDLEREAFYQMLDAVSRTQPGELHAVATTELRTAAQLWKTDLAAQRKSADAAPEKLAELQRQLDRAADEAEDVAPLFNTPEESRGRLVTLVGTARRAIEIRVDDVDIRERFGLEHYYEIELVTPDSRGNPIAFCVLELPPGMPTGDDLYESIRATGFFLKTWSFRTAQSAEAEPGTVRKQLAPLLIGRDVMRLTNEAAPDESRGFTVAIVAAFVAGVFAVAWWLHRDAGRKKPLPDRIAIPPAESP